MEEALEMARAKDTKERMAGVERLLELLESSRKSLSSSDVTSLVDCCLDLLKDNNFRVSQGGLQALDSAAIVSGDHFKLHFNALVPATVERLGDAKQPVRDAARRLLLTLMQDTIASANLTRVPLLVVQVSSPTLIVERAGSNAWTHRSWRVREEFARTVTSAISLFASTELPLQRAILPPILQMLYDPNPGVREAAILCIEEMYAQIGFQFREELQRHQLPSSLVKDINARLERIEPKHHSSDVHVGTHAPADTKHSNRNPKRSSTKAKSSSREVSLFGGESDVNEKPVDSIKVYSEKELIREFEKIASTLVPEKDWSIRIGAMQRVEGLVIGGATDYSCFRGLLKQLVGPLSTQLADRRSSIVKQACHLLNFLSKELLGDFEACAEIFIPVLFKLVVITVLVIAESADNCIKTMLRNCKVTRILPRVADTAKHDRSSLLRARCCEYALLILEYWADAPEIHRSADLYEDLIKCCVGDAMSEVRATARACYRMFSKTWPERSRRLFSQFDPVIQRIINDEDGGMHRRHASPLLRDRTPQIKEKVSAIESMLKGFDFDRVKSSSLDLGVDPPSSRDPPFPLAVPASNKLSVFSSLDTTNSGISKGSNHDGGLALSDIITQIQASRDAAKHSNQGSVGNETLSSLSSYTARRAEKHQERGSFEDKNDVKGGRQSVNLHMDRQYFDTPHRDSHYRDSHNSHVPNFQRPLSRKNVSGRMSANRRRSFDDSQLISGEMSSYTDGPASLNDALSDGLSSSSDWHARVAAFSYLRSLLQQGSRGIQEVMQSFEKVMKMFFQHLDDPHHKVAQAALTTLADIIPACRKPFESYMERILPHVFSRLIDPKELVRQPCSATLEIVGKIYGVDSLLPALLRSLDEQRSPKAKLAVIEFAVTSFNKHATNSEGSGNSGILKLWLAKLTPLVHDKNTRLKEAAITCIISVYSHFDSTSVLNYILSLSVEEQNSFRRALKQLTPRIEVDLMNYLQQRKDRQRSKSSYDPYDVVGTSSEEGYIGASKKTPLFGSEDQLYQGLEIGSNNDVFTSNSKDTLNAADAVSDKVRSWTTRSEILEHNTNLGVSSIPHINGLVNSSEQQIAVGCNYDNVAPHELELGLSKLTASEINSSADTASSIPQILSLICNGNDDYSTASKCTALQQLVDASEVNDSSIWTKYFNQILTVGLEVLDNNDSSVQELALALIVEMLKNQKDGMEDSVEIVVEKLLHVTKVTNPKVASEAEHCLTIVLSQYDPFRSLSVIIPLLVAEDEKTLLVDRLSQDELMAQLPLFLPALFDAFGNQSADVRKLRLVTIYANRISQARTGTPIEG
ncbi:Armadillo-like helical [Cynara cardunculus var. scolymus]|uniref:Armadillo-like helical n=1 Tax=Cynara cardunculus var. scolymus TaxID=59895 RepID=A0A124SCN0_CYNCS|nr:Armadillo-like helical [Cynara cardunculus var. scolymus]